MPECFVAQCFDGGTYDQRYLETFAPAIKAGGASPVRADETLGTKPIIEKIEHALRRSAIIFAEVSENNPNVFLELGYALAIGVPAVIVCDRAKREKLPFDIQHRPIIFYETSAESDFAKLRERVTSNVAFALSEAEEKRASEQGVAAATTTVDEIKHLCLLQLLESDMRSPVGSTVWSLQQSLPPGRVNDRMLALALTSLQAEQLVEARRQEDSHDGEYNTYGLTEEGKKLLLREYSSLMEEEARRLNAKPANRPAPATFDDLDDDLPF